MFKFSVFAIAVLFSIFPYFTMAENNKPLIYETEKSIVVGLTPLKSYYNSDNKKTTVFCYGYDADYDGIFDDGDEKPSIWVGLDDETTFEKVYEFDFNSFHFPYSPFRPAIDRVQQLIYIPLTTKIVVYNPITEQFDETKTINVVANSVSLSADKKFLFATLPYQNNNEGTVAIIDLETNQIINEFYGGINILESISYTRINQSGESISGLAVLSVGNFGTEESTLYYGDLINNSEWSVDSIVIGNAGNNIMFYENKIFATVNMSNKIVSLDVNTNDYKEFSTGTNGYNGPREITVWDNKLFVTMYLGDVRYFDINTGEIDGSFGYYVKYESIEVVGEFAIVSAPSDQSYSPNDKIYFVAPKEDHAFPNRIDVQVGARPLFVFFEPYSMVLHVLCQGVDKNGNGIEDSGDEMPTYWTIRSNTIDIWEDIVAELPFNSLEYPLYPEFDDRTGTFFLPQGDFVMSYKMNNLMDYEIAIPFKTKHLDIIDNYLIVTPHQSMPNKDSIYLYDIDTKQIVRSMYGGTNPTMAIYCNNVKLNNEEQPAIAVLNEINEEKSVINLIRFYDTETEINTSIEIEKANIIKFRDNILFATHKKSISKIETDNDEIKVNYIADMCGGNAEITSLEILDDVAVCTFSNGKMRSYEMIDNTVYPSPVVSKGNISSMEYFKKSTVQIIASANIKELDGSNSNFVSVWGKWLSSVETINDEVVNTIKVYPNPAKDFTTISLELNSEVLENIAVSINSITGQELSTFNFTLAELNEMKLPISNLQSGTYLLKINIGNNEYHTKLNVVK